MNIPSNFTLEEALKELDLPSEILIILEKANQIHLDTVYDLEEEIKTQDEKIERLEEVQCNAENLVSSLEQELLCKDFRYTETKNLVKKLTDLIENCNIEV